jgi:hypothetical protein
MVCLHEVQKVRLVFTQGRLVAVLKEMTGALVAPVEVRRVAGEQSPHRALEGLGAGPH